jgi:UDPglucose 6-dehydrogenase
LSPPLVGFAGMTHLGLVSATAAAAKGLPTRCYDPNRDLIERLSNGELPVHEPDLASLQDANAGLQQFSADLDALRDCDVVYISPDVPTDSHANSDLAAVFALTNDVASVLKADAVMVMLSQVPPGFSRALTAVPHERLYYQVETLIFGRAVERAMKPERFIVGCADPQNPLNPRFAAVLSAFDCPILTMRYESAELAKIAINFCLVASIGVANTLSEICERIGADWSEIVPALKLDRRIGPDAYLAPGLGIAGGNLERDLMTILSLSRRYVTDAQIVHACLANSRHRGQWAARTLRDALLAGSPRAKVAVWGLAYKENTHSIKNSPALAALAQLPNTCFMLHDPVVPASALPNARAVSAGDPLAMLAGADALMILTAWPQYRAIAPEKIARAMRGRIVLDPYRVLDRSRAIEAGLEYHTLGARQFDRENRERS